MREESEVAQSCLTLSIPWTVAYQAPPSMEFSRQEYWSGLSIPSPGDLPNPGTEPGSTALQADALPSKPPGKQAMEEKLVFLTTGNKFNSLIHCHPLFWKNLPSWFCKSLLKTTILEFIFLCDSVLMALLQ